MGGPDGLESGITLIIDSRLTDVHLVSGAVAGICREYGFLRDAVDEIQLCAAEAVNNAVIHAYGNRPGRPVKVVVAPEDNKLVIKIMDQGESMPGLEIKNLAFDPHDLGALPDGGFGLPIMARVMDELDYRREAGFNVLQLVKAIPARQKGRTG